MFGFMNLWQEQQCRYWASFRCNCVQKNHLPVSFSLSQNKLQRLEEPGGSHLSTWFQFGDLGDSAGRHRPPLAAVNDSNAKHDRQQMLLFWNRNAGSCIMPFGCGWHFILKGADFFSPAVVHTGAPASWTFVRRLRAIRVGNRGRVRVCACVCDCGSRAAASRLHFNTTRTDEQM